jgi:Cu(I)/Ag(I) efflux system membrane fusion protein
MLNKTLSQILLFLLIFSGAVSCSDSGKKEHSHETEQVEENIETYWTCPMHPQVKEDGPGKCPICGMTLVKATVDRGETKKTTSDQKIKDLWQCKDHPDVTSEVEELCPVDGTPMVRASSEQAGKVIANVKLRDAQLSHFNPAYYPATQMKMEKKIRLLGTVLPSEEKERSIPARIPGRVEKVYIKSTGSYVKEGAPVLELYSPELITAGEEYLIARRNVETNPSKVFRDLLKQSKERLKLWGMKDFQVEKWYKSGKVPRSVTIYSPASGVVQKRNAVEGKYFKEGQNFFELSELSTVWIEMDVYEHDSGIVEIGQDVSLEFTALPEQEIKSQIDFINPVLNPESRTLKVRTTVQNPNGKLKPGMVADATLNIELEGRPLVIPRSAIIDTGKRKVVWIKVADKTYQAQLVKTGYESQGYVEVLDGIQEGDQVVIEGNFLLDAQAQLFGGYEDFNQ